MKRYIAILPAALLLAAACSFNNPFLEDDPKAEDPAPPSYAITVSPSGAAAGESVSADVSEAREGATVTLTAALGSGRQAVLNGAGITITPSTVNTNGATASFTMPAVAVEVTAAFSYYAGGPVTHTANAVSFNMHYVPSGGPFTMGEHIESTTQDVTLTKNFWMGETEVTQGLWEDVWEGWPDTEPSSGYGLGDNYPAYFINWFEAVAFCNLLTIADAGIADTEQVYYSDAGLDIANAYTKTDAAGHNAVHVDWSKTGYRLPTEAEWEYAARFIDGASWNHGNHASGDTEYACYDAASCSHELASDDRISEYAWWYGNNGNSGDPDYGSKEVGHKRANALGLRDISGNISEWCYDWDALYSGGSEIDPIGPSSGSCRARHGGSWVSSAPYLRNSHRQNIDPPVARYRYIGLRLCRTAD